MTPEQAFDNYAVHGATVQDFAEFIGQDATWLADQIADMDPDNADPMATATAFMEYVATETAKANDE